MKSRLIILGSGGHAKVIADAALKSKQFTIIGFLDDSVQVNTEVMNNYFVLGRISDLERMAAKTDFFALGIGNIAVRKKIAAEWGNRVSWANIIHPSASIADHTEMGVGTVVLANAVLNWGTIIGEFSIVDSGVIVDHECKIGNFVHLSIGTCVGSNSIMPAETKTKVGQAIEPFYNPDTNV